MQKKMKQTYIIAEAGVNHNGQLNLALRLCDQAKSSGVDAIKFQTWKTDKILTKSVEMAQYQKKNLLSKDSQYEMIKKLELSYDDFKKIKKHCDKINLQFLSTPDEIESLEFLISLGMEKIKIGSGEINNIPFLRQIGKKKKDVILSTGMSYLADVEKAYHELISHGAKSVVLLHCTTNYPCLIEEVNLNAMLTLKDAFKCEVGYSDHTEGIYIPIAAVSMGAQVIEKHFTLNKRMKGPDHKSSINKDQLTEMVKAIRSIEIAFGNGIKQPNKSELKISQVILKKIVANTNIKKGEKFTRNNITVKRANNGISASYWDLIIGSIAEKNYLKDESIQLKNISIQDRNQ